MFNVLLRAEGEIRAGAGYEATRRKHKIHKNEKADRIFKLYCYKKGAI